MICGRRLTSESIAYLHQQRRVTGRRGGKGKGVNKGQSKLKQGARSYTVILIHQNCPKRSISNRKNWVGMNSNTTKGSC